ncbi:sulfurtransferase [Rhodanobacter glycinis]|uniref:Sulfurtransferase n=1 Tax=Rhodanobacter glycinis TaxID=582702 RepID=A0A502BYA1_9GAMM|nr:sulfurtransferase [Rhodanobacter glycinis]TPG04476.1 sulfurtransferase [Rhodanobacter glycinis]TPG49988.1 sulfurtransferase [Rhodanobacter glycinis]
MTLKTTLIDATELAAWPPHEVLIVDCRFDLADPAKGGRDYLDGHIPGAVFASLDHDLSDLSRQAEGLGRHPLPLEPAFNALLSRWGWHAGMQVVSYDAGSGALAAARLWWLLRLVGVHEVAVLDGGYAAWLAAGLPVESGAAAARTATRVSLRYDESQVLLDHAVLLGGASGRLLDARATPRYRGDVEPLDRVGGHVPGALNRPFADNLGSDGRFKPAAQLRDEFTAVLGSTAPSQVVHMCGSGVTACHNLLAMEHAGLHGSRLYAPSWSGWVSDPTRAVAKG